MNLVEANVEEGVNEVNAIGQRQVRRTDNRRQLTLRDAQESSKYWVNAKTKKVCYVNETKLPALTEEQMRSWKSIPNKAFVALTSRIGGNKHNRRNLRQRNMVEKAYEKGRNVRIGRKQYRAFEIDEGDQCCPVFEEIAEQIALVDVDSGSETEALPEEAHFLEDENEDELIPGNINEVLQINEIFSLTNAVKKTTKERNMAYAKFKVIDSNNEIKEFKVLCDSGASCNACPEEFVSIIMHKWSGNVSTVDCEASEAKVANGNALRFENYNANFDITFTDKFKLKFSNTKVHKAGGNTIILGRPGMVENVVEMQVDKNPGKAELKFTIRGSSLEALWKDTGSSPLNDLNEIRLAGEVKNVESVLERTPTFYNHLYEGSEFKNERPIDAFDPNGTRAWYRKIERIHQENRNKNTVEDVIVDPNNEVLSGDRKTKDKLDAILNKYRSVFESTVGQVTAKEFEVHATIDPAKSDRSPKSAPLWYGKNLPESIQKGIEDTLDKEAAEGILRFLPKGMTALNSVSFFGVGKRDAETAKIEMSPTNVRIVVDCSKGLNDNTQHCA